MKGLDSWIMGLNDPNAPFNQVDLVDYYAPVIDISDWITDEMLENENSLNNLVDALDNAFSLLLKRETGEKIKLMQTHAKWISELAHIEYDFLMG